MTKIKKLIICLSVLLCFGFTSNQSTEEYKGRYQMMQKCETGELLMLDTTTGHLYQYDWTFNHWKSLTFGNHILWP